MATSTDLRAAIEEVQDNLPAGELEAEGALGAYGPDWARKLEQRVGALPWWVISAVVHAVLFLLVTLLTVAVADTPEDTVIISTDMAKKKPPEYDEKKKRDIFKNPHEIKSEQQIDKPMVVHEQVEVTDHFETENDMDKQTARGHEDAISDIPLGGVGVTGVMGVGGGGMAGCFGYRDGGGRKKAVARFGGSPATESAVEAALRWLARHQERNGSWDAFKYEAGATTGGNVRIRVGCTGLATLAFLGAGHTHKSGKFRDNVLRAVNWLISQQKKSGGIFERGKGGSRVSAGYNHAIAGLALAEVYGMTKDPALRGPAQKAVEYSTKVHQAPYSGWRYDPKQGPDTSVTGWFVMQLKSAKIAGLRVDSSGFQGASAFLNKVTAKNGRAGYTSVSTRTPAMTSVAMVCRQFMGTPNTSPLLMGGAQQLVGAANLPAWKSNDKHEDFYYLYYGTLAMFQMGGGSWKLWNQKLKPVLVDNQRKGGPMDGSTNDVDGSWDPYGMSGVRAGRVFMTAVGALSLEVYYRYLPMYAK